MDGSSVVEVCMRISIDSPHLGLIREAWAEAAQKENWKQERIRGDIDRFAMDSRELFIGLGV